jgi:hypothetical protein
MWKMTTSIGASCQGPLYFEIELKADARRGAH